MASSQNSKGDSSKRDAPKKGKTPSGVRGPGGPPPAPTPGASSARPGGRGPAGSRPMMGAASASPSDLRRRFERFSYPLLARLHVVPRWIIVVFPALLLFLGLVLTGPLAWLGGLLLLLVSVLLGWLTALSWPAITPGSRLLRVVVVAALVGVAVLKLLGRF
jgi:hypothetical protein